jgi:hypothetical protein
MNGRLQTLSDALAVLSWDADAQLKHLADEGIAGCVDELALDYDGIAAAANDMLEVGAINEEQRDCVDSLNRFVQQFSGEANTHLWTAQALRSAEEWKQVRSMARNCLALFRRDSRTA